MVGKLPSHMPYLLAHARKSVGALSRADRPDAARKTDIPSRFFTGCQFSFNMLILASAGWVLREQEGLKI